MNSDLQISDDYILPLFDEIFVVKERDFSIEYHPMGMGKQKLLLLVTNDITEFPENNDLQLLLSIIDKGLRKQLEDVWIVNIARFPQADIARIWEHFEPMQVIVWGCTKWLKEQNLPTEIHKQFYVQGAELLTAGDLASYLTDNVSKGKLWTALQRMFFN